MTCEQKVSASVASDKSNYGSHYTPEPHFQTGYVITWIRAIPDERCAVANLTLWWIWVMTYLPFVFFFSVFLASLSWAWDFFMAKMTRIFSTHSKLHPTRRTPYEAWPGLAWPSGSKNVESMSYMIMKLITAHYTLSSLEITVYSRVKNWRIDLWLWKEEDCCWELTFPGVDQEPQYWTLHMTADMSYSSRPSLGLDH